MHSFDITEQKIEDFRLYLKEEERLQGTIEKYIRDIRRFAEWSNGREITKQLVIEWKECFGSKIGN